MKYKYETGENVKRSKNFEKRKKFYEKNNRLYKKNLEKYDSGNFNKKSLSYD